MCANYLLRYLFFLRWILFFESTYLFDNFRTFNSLIALAMFAFPTIFLVVLILFVYPNIGAYKNIFQMFPVVLRFPFSRWALFEVLGISQGSFPLPVHDAWEILIMFIHILGVWELLCHLVLFKMSTHLFGFSLHYFSFSVCFIRRFFWGDR